MIDDWRKLLGFFTAGDRRRILALLVSTTASGLLQAVGIASILPFIAVVADPSLINENAYLQRAYDWLGFTEPNGFLVFLGIFAFVVLLATNLLVGVNAWLTFRVCHLGEHDLARRLLRRYLQRPYLHLLSRNSSELIKMVVSEIDRVVIGTLMAGIGVFADTVTTLFVIALLLLINPWITLVTLAVLAAAYLLIYLVITPKVTKLGSEFGPLSTEIYKTAYEALGAAKEIKVRGREEHFVSRFSRPLLRSSKNAIRYNTLDIVPAQALELLAFGGLVMTTVYLTYRSGGTGGILPTIAMFGFAAYRLIPALKSLFDGVEVVRFNLPALDGIWQEYDGADDESARERQAALMPRSSIRLEGLSFRYPEARQDTVTALDITLKCGSSLCLVGPTGAGKSTTVDLLLGLLTPSQGRVLVDDVPITADNVRAWQNAIGYVPQVVYLIDDTVASNIALGLEPDEIDRARLERAARLAQIHDFIVTELPGGYEAVVGERGARLSGGQRQRIGIARALYHDPAVLVLDEATNELDLATETRLLGELRSLPNRTIVSVSHKPSVAASSDCIVVLDKGRIVAQGSYAEITRPGEPYRHLLQEG